MRLTTVQLFFLMLLSTTTTTCSRQFLTGNWKVQNVKLIDMMHRNTFTVDLTQVDQVKKQMLALALKERQVEGERIDTGKVEAEIEKTVNAFKRAELSLTDDHKFAMFSNGLLVPASVPGWHFGDSLAVTWTKANDLLVLFTGDHDQGYEWKFKVVQLTRNKLKLQQISQGARGTNDVLDGPKNELEFVRR